MRSCRERVVFDDGGELKLKGKENLVMSYAPLRQRQQVRLSSVMTAGSGEFGELAGLDDGGGGGGGRGHGGQHAPGWGGPSNPMAGRGRGGMSGRRDSIEEEDEGMLEEGPASPQHVGSPVTAPRPGQRGSAARTKVGPATFFSPHRRVPSSSRGAADIARRA